MFLKLCLVYHFNPYHIMPGRQHIYHNIQFSFLVISKMFICQKSINTILQCLSHINYLVIRELSNQFNNLKTFLTERRACIKMLYKPTFIALQVCESYKHTFDTDALHDFVTVYIDPQSSNPVLTSFVSCYFIQLIHIFLFDHYTA